MSLKEYREKMEAQLKDLAAKLEEWKDKGAKATTETRAEMNKQLEQMRPRLEAAQQKLKELEAASGETAEKLKAATETALAETKKAWENIKSKFSKPTGEP